MKIISLKICPFVQRITAILEAKNIEYEIEFIDLKNKPKWFLDISPNGQVPVLILDNDEALFESDAIAEYIDEAYPSLEPNISLEQKARNRAWSYLASKNYLVQCSMMRSPDENSLKERSAKINKAFDIVEKQLGSNSFFSGGPLGMVDIAWLPILHRAEIVSRKVGYDILENHPKLKAWQTKLIGTGLAKKSVAPDFEEVFSEFYLSEKTYLGRSS